MEYSSGAYIVSRRSRKSAPRYREPRHRRGAGILLACLLLLTAAICLLIVFLPRLTSAGVGASPEFDGRTFYFLATAKSDDRNTAIENATAAAARGGAGYIYNNGAYNVIAAAYAREADASALATVNSGSYYFAVTVPSCSGDATVRLLEHITGEFFDTLYTVSTELDRGVIPEAAAELTVYNACRKLETFEKPEVPALAHAVEALCDFGVPTGRTVLSQIRYTAVRAVALTAAAIGG